MKKALLTLVIPSLLAGCNTSDNDSQPPAPATQAYEYLVQLSSSAEGIGARPTGTEAETRAAAIIGQPVSVIISGPSEAATGTAEAIAAVCGEKIKAIPELADPSLGLWEGLREADVEARWPSAYEQWKADPFAVSVPNGEPMEAAKDRMVEVLRKLLPKHASTSGAIVVVLRPTALGMARCYFEGHDTTRLWEVAFEGEGVLRLTLDAERLRERLGLPCVEAPVSVLESKRQKSTLSKPGKPVPSRL